MIDEENNIIEKIFNSKKVPYKVLTPLIKPYISKFNIKPMSNVNIFIDVFNVMKQIYNPQTIESFNSLKNSERRLIASHLINMVSHYRHFFASRYQMYTTFYFFSSFQECTTLQKYNEDYKKTFYEKRIDLENPIFGIINNIVKENLKLTKSFLEYVPHAYYIDGYELEPNVIPFNIITRNNNDEMNIIISNDEIFYQDLIINDCTLQLELRGDKTRFVTSENLYETLLEKTKKDPSQLTILPEMITLIQGLSSFKDYDIKGVKNMGNARAINFVQNALNKNVISNIEYTDPDVLKSLMIKDLLNGEEYQLLCLNMNQVNHRLINSKNNYDIIIDSQLTDRVDPDGVKKVNNKYFERCPILIDYCFEGEEY